MRFDWCYVVLDPDGYLREEDGRVYVSERTFNSVEEADRYLVDNDLRATIR